MAKLADKLKDIMEIDHVVRVNSDGSVTHSVPGAYAPEVLIMLDDDGQITNDAEADMVKQAELAGWDLMSGYSGQYMTKATDVIMHPSEYIGGRLAEDILERPGLYVAVEVVGLSGDEDNSAPSDDPIGWVVARKLDVA